MAHSPSRQVFNHKSDDRVGGMIQKGSCTGNVLGKGNYKFPASWGWHQGKATSTFWMDVECYSGVFRTAVNNTKPPSKKATEG